MNAPLKRTTILLSMLGLLALQSCGTDQGPPPGPPEVTVAKVLSKRIKDWDEYTGRFQAVDTVEVRPRVSGYVDQFMFREGQLVKKDDVLVIIDPRPYQADYDRAKAGLELAKSQRELAGLEAGRVQKLKDSGAVSRGAR
jgi:multidrug efflux pump subunit AcrA (membrane-fusion protein)